MTRVMQEATHTLSLSLCCTLFSSLSYKGGGRTHAQWTEEHRMIEPPTDHTTSTESTSTDSPLGKRQAELRAVRAGNYPNQM